LKRETPTWSRVAGRIRVPLGFLAAAAYLWLARPDRLSLIVGAALASMGIVIRAVASGHLRKNEELTTTGPYACTRNPLYLGSIIVAAGFAVAARSGWVVALLLGLFFAVYLPVIRSEEAFLRSHFPEYASYAARVPRFVPRLGGISKVGSGFSLELYFKHREYNAIVGALLVIAALVAKLIWWGA
jgi:protein-S-isoprenylcysteine O-methyltransferase Ste14